MFTLKRLISIVITVVMLLCTCGIFCMAEDKTVFIAADDTLTFTGRGALEKSPVLSDYYKTAKRVVICEGVTEIPSDFFSPFTALTQAILPSTLTKAEYAFRLCTALESVTFSQGTETLPDAVLSLTPALKSVKLPNSVTTIGFAAFEGSGIESVTLPDSVTTIGFNAFSNCRALKSITLSEGLECIGESAFEGSALTSVTIPDGVREIMDNAFRRCGALTDVSMPHSLEKMGMEVFAGTPIIEKKDKDGAVYADTCLVDATGVTGEYEIKDGTRTIARHAFVGNKKITAVSIPASVIGIGYEAFYECHELAEVETACTPSYVGERAFSYTAFYHDESRREGGALYVGGALVDTWKDIKYCEVKSGTVTIGGEAFKDCRARVKLPSTVKYICDSAFSGNYSKNLIIPEGVQSIGVTAFSSEHLKTVSLPSTLERAEVNAFFYCDSLERIEYNGTREKWNALGIFLPDGVMLKYKNGTVFNPRPETNDHGDGYDDIPDDYEVYVPSYEVEVIEPEVEITPPEEPEPEPEMSESEFESEPEPEIQRPKPDKKENKAKKNGNLWWIAVIVAAAVIGGIAVFVVVYRLHKKDTSDPDIDVFTE